LLVLAAPWVGHSERDRAELIRGGMQRQSGLRLAFLLDEDGPAAAERHGEIVPVVRGETDGRRHDALAALALDVGLPDGGLDGGLAPGRGEGVGREVVPHQSPGHPVHDLMLEVLGVAAHLAHRAADGALPGRIQQCGHLGKRCDISSGIQLVLQAHFHASLRVHSGTFS
jgi:hypothetical protein